MVQYPPTETASGEGLGGGGGTRSALKRQAILSAASEIFLRNGYAHTSVDEIASKAAVSKQTVYKQFGDKEKLFTELILGVIDKASVPDHAGIAALRDTQDLATDLRAYARMLVGIVMQPRVLRLRRLIVAEADRFPALAKTYYERGPKRTTEAMADCFEHLASRGLLVFDDKILAAEHFNWLVLSIPLNRIMLGGDPARPADHDLVRMADAGTAAFLRAYGVGESERSIGE